MHIEVSHDNMQRFRRRLETLYPEHVDDAIERLQRSQPDEPKFGEARFQLAILELERGRVDEARRSLHEALEASPQLEQMLPKVPGLADLR